MEPKTYFISLSRKSVVDAYLWEKDEENYENGSRCLDIFPGQIAFSGRGKSAEDPYHAKIQFVQAGCSYGPDVRSSSYSSFDLDSLFSEEQNSDFRDMDFNFSETRYEARKQWAEENNIEMEEVEENHLDKNWKHYDAVEEVEDDWVVQHSEFNRETAMSALVDELEDEEKGITYKIVWED